MHSPDNDLTRIFMEHYDERVSIMEIDGHDNNAEYNAYADTVRAIQEKTSCRIECLPSLEYCKTSQKHF